MPDAHHDGRGRSQDNQPPDDNGRSVSDTRLPEVLLRPSRHAPSDIERNLRMLRMVQLSEEEFIAESKGVWQTIDRDGWPAEWGSEPAPGDDREQRMFALISLLDRAQSGDRDAQFELGKRYLEGEGLISNDEEAVEWLRKSAASGHTGARFILSSLGLE